MARLSKSHHFKIFQDTGIPTPPGDEHDPFDDAVSQRRDSTAPSNHETTSNHERSSATNNPFSDANDDEDAISRDSLSSVSTFPESTSQQDDTNYEPPPASPQKFFNPQIIRPSFRRPESVRRMQMSSPRQSILSDHRSSSSGTPRSQFGRGSPRGRRRVTEELTEELTEEEEEHPLVLLHVTLLPISLPWSMESIQELLPAQVVENLLLLRSRVSHTVQQRGILIPHPKEEYEMLEERLLEALELKEERLTKCGHFRGRVSDASLKSSGRDSDFGLSSSASGSDDGEVCTTCRHHVRRIAGKKQEWSVKVFAANGLMRASAWAAAWEGMESVDVEILPWIGEDDRGKLDRRREEEERERRFDVEEEKGRSDVMLLQQETGLEAEAEGEDESYNGARHTYDTASTTIQMHPAQRQSKPSLQEETIHDLPTIYRASQVPLSVLLRNYIYLLAQDRRTVAMFFLAVVAIFFAARSIPFRPDPALVPPPDALTSTSQNEASTQMHQQDNGLSNIVSVARPIIGVPEEKEEVTVSALEQIPEHSETLS